MEENGRFIFEDENGEKKELEVYFTYHSEEFDKDFIVFIDDELDKVIEAYQNDKIKFEVEE